MESRQVTLCRQYSIVKDKIASLNATQPVNLVCVSKTYPASDILDIYTHTGHRVFGENYVQELVEKAAQLPVDIQWHFIGSLQRNKVKLLLSVQNLVVIETVDSEKLAEAIEKQLANTERKIRVFVQINTSGENSKSGLNVNDTESIVQVCRYIVEKCSHLKLSGFMTIGAPDETRTLDFERLFNTRQLLAETLGVDPVSLELSMGMSSDFDQAILAGSTNVRIGSTIFGARQQKK